MRALFIIFALQLSAVAGVRSRAKKKRANYSGYVVLRVEPKTKAQLTALDEKKMVKKGIGADFWNGPGPVGYAFDIMFCGKTLPKAEAYLKSHKISYEVTIQDVQSAIDATLPGPSINNGEWTYDQYHTFKEITTWVTATAKANSNAEKFTIGKSGDGRDTTGLVINAGADKPVIFMVCGIHAREWVSPAACMWIANELIKGNGDGMQDFEWYIVPSSNPDGYEWTWNGDRMWRKTRSAKQGRFCNVGVDPNRNWNFSHCSESRELNCRGDAYCGKEPFSEPETANVANFAQQLQSSGRDVRSFIDVHAFSQMVLWPWGYTSQPTKDAQAIAKCGNALADAIAAVENSWWRRGPIATTIYKAGGSSVDWTYSELGITYSYALELRDTGRNGFLLPPNQILPAAKEYFEGLKALAACIA